MFSLHYLPVDLMQQCLEVKYIWWCFVTSHRSPYHSAAARRCRERTSVSVRLQMMLLV